MGYMKKVLGLLLFWTVYASAVGMPLEENLSISSLDNGIEIWLKKYAMPRQTIFCRVIAKNPLEPVPEIFYLNDCPLNAFEDELPCFVDYCREKIRNIEQCKIAVVAVGDFEEESVGKYLAEAFEGFSPRMTMPSTAPIKVESSAESNMVYLSLAYSTSFQELKTDKDLKKLWVLYLLQSVIEERFRKIVKDGDGQWIQSAPVKYLLPCSYTIARSKQVLTQDPLNMLSAFLVIMQEVKTNGFSEQELSDAKAKLQKNLGNFNQQNPTSSTLADYLASHFALGAGHPDYSIFMTMSFKAISEIQRADVAEHMGIYFLDAARRVEMKIPPQVSITEASIQAILDAHRTDNLVLNLDGNILDSNSPYNQLPITEAEAQVIYKIIDTVGNNGYGTLLLKRGELRDLGNKVQHIHPLRFLGTLFTNPDLKKCMVEVQSKNLKWRGFMDGDHPTPGFVAKCEREYARNNFEPYILSFCQAVKAHPDQVRALIEKREWEKLVQYLILLEN